MDTATYLVPLAVSLNVSLFRVCDPSEFAKPNERIAVGSAEYDLYYEKRPARIMYTAPMSEPRSRVNVLLNAKYCTQFTDILRYGQI